MSTHSQNVARILQKLAESELFNYSINERVIAIKRKKLTPWQK